MILVTGYNGQLGYDVVEKLNKEGVKCLGIDRVELDITDESSVNVFVDKIKPRAIIHCAAYTAVDKAEDDFENCKKVNVDGTRFLVNAAKRNNCKFMYISTDYVFDGSGENFYEIDDVTNPISVYGKTKLAGEIIVKDSISDFFIVRISWVFGMNGNNFINTMLKLGSERDELNVVGDQIGSPTSTYDLANLIYEMILTEKYGIYHATNEGICSWAEFAEEIMMIANLECKINHITTNEYPTKALRPSNSRLSKKSLELNGFNKLQNWKSSIRNYIEKKRG